MHIHKNEAFNNDATQRLHLHRAADQKNIATINTKGRGVFSDVSPVVQYMSKKGGSALADSGHTAQT